MSPPEEADADAAEDAPMCGLGIANAVLGNPGGGCGVVKGNGPGGGPGGCGCGGPITAGVPVAFSDSSSERALPSHARAPLTNPDLPGTRTKPQMGVTAENSAHKNAPFGLALVVPG